MLWEQLEIKRGILCLTGSGGKTTLAHVLARQLPGTVLFCTTTRIWPSETLPVLKSPTEADIRMALTEHRAICAGEPAERGKLGALSLSMECLRQMADYVIVEADGSKGLPLKAHLAYEPVIPPETDKILLVVGASGFGKPIDKAVHRPEPFAALCGASLEETATPERVAQVLAREGGFDAVVVNQVDGESRMALSRRLADRLTVPVFAGEVRDGHLTRIR